MPKIRPNTFYKIYKYYRVYNPDDMNIERRIREIFNWQEKKEREYLTIASDIIDAILARMGSKYIARFELPFGISRVSGTSMVARCYVNGRRSIDRWHRKAVIIEEKEDFYLDERAERCVTIISDEEYRQYHKFPFCQYIEGIHNEGEMRVLTLVADPQDNQDLRPTMWKFLQSIPNWKPVTSLSN